MSATARLMAFVKDRPLQWIPATAFEQFGRQAWRTRLSEARKKFEAVKDGTIENRQRRVERHNSLGIAIYVVSEYRYVPAAAPVATAGHDTTWGLRP